MQDYEGAVAELEERYKTKDPFVIAERLGIRIVKCVLPPSVRSYHLVIGAVFWLFLNSMLPTSVHQDLVSRAIAHQQLHADAGELSEKQKAEAALFANVLQGIGKKQQA